MVVMRPALVACLLSLMVESTVGQKRCNETTGAFEYMLGHCISVKMLNRGDLPKQEESLNDCPDKDNEFKWLLPKLDSHQKYAALNESIKRMPTRPAGSEGIFWLGLVRDEPTTEEEWQDQKKWRDPSKWRWTLDNTKLASHPGPNGSLPWGQEEPNNGQVTDTNKPEKKTCVIARLSMIDYSVRWVDSTCEPFPLYKDKEFALSVCESKPIQVTNTTETTSSTEAQKSSTPAPKPAKPTPEVQQSLTTTEPASTTESKPTPEAQESSTTTEPASTMAESKPAPEVQPEPTEESGTTPGAGVRKANGDQDRNAVLGSDGERVALGIGLTLVVVCAIVIGIVVYRRRKKQRIWRETMGMTHTASTYQTKSIADVVPNPETDDDGPNPDDDSLAVFNMSLSEKKQAKQKKNLPYHYERLTPKDGGPAELKRVYDSESPDRSVRSWKQAKSKKKQSTSKGSKKATGSQRK